MNLYPEQLRYLAALCDALNEFDKNNDSDDHSLMIKNGIPITDAADQTEVYGHLVDEIGGVWSFRPVKDAEVE